MTQLSTDAFFFFKSILLFAFIAELLCRSPLTLAGTQSLALFVHFIAVIHLLGRLRLVGKHESDPAGKDSLWCIDAPVSVV